MQQEYVSLLENHTFTPVEYTYSKPLGCKWVYKTKMNTDGTLRYKARLVIKVYEQVEGVDFEETYAPVSKLPSLRYLMSCAAQGGWEIDQLNVVTAFLNPAIDKDVYMQLPEGIEWLINKPLPAGSTHKSTHKSTHNLRAESHSAESVRIWWRPEMRRRPDMSESPSASSGDSLPSFTPGESLRRVVYKENVPPSTLYQSTNLQSSPFIDPYIPTESRAESVSTPASNSASVSTPDRNTETPGLSIFMNGPLKLNKALYDLKQAPLLWHATINMFLLSIGCIRAHADENLYLRSGVFLLLYVDDTQIFYPPSASKAAEDLKAALKKEYKMTALGKAKQLLGFEIERHDYGAISLGQSKYIRTILKRIGMDDANPVTTLSTIR